MAKTLLVVAPKIFRDEEALETKRIFEENKVGVVVASKGVRIAEGKFGAKLNVDEDIYNVNVDVFDAVVFIGGKGCSIYLDDEKVLNLARDAYKKGKIVAAICMAPSILANAGILEGKKATAFESEEENLKNKGAIFTGEAVTEDGNIITGNGPSAAREFGARIIETLIK